MSILFAWLCGLGCGYIVFAPETRLKRAFMDGLTLRRMWMKR